MEILSFEGGAQSPRKKKSLGLVLGAAAIAGVMALGSTLAASVTIGSGAITFGQGVAQAAACDPDITLTPGAGFINDMGAGTFKLETITVSGVDADCDGETFIIKAWDDNPTSNALVLFGGTETEISSVINAVSPTSSSVPMGVTIDTNIAGDYIYIITNPSLDAEDIYKLTIEQESTPDVGP
jgi:hypothetical protein